MKTLDKWQFDTTWTSDEKNSAKTLGEPNSDTVLPLDFEWFKTGKYVDLHGNVVIDKVWLSLVNPVTHEFFDVIRYDEYATGYKYIEPDEKYLYGHYEGEITRQFLVLERDKIDNQGFMVPEELGILDVADCLIIKTWADSWRAAHGNSPYMFWATEHGSEMNVDPEESYDIPVLKLF
ncbi:hypothetical protein [Lactiplantibacillus plantarum]|uniref:hypothetical protein n=1 Tax=Lactiplantibacillus plantarum TaxID=1590 RepID=UPI0021A718A0|nr:hypothetical protein [Lactiplantibacillus plantarum]MCT3206454.1 hypothetical protein [Lactiplantibacillus plantarum]MCT3220170.1 hypothetical protein [Lactiplantibacillus plantarum]MCT3281496.1 hypothetical protein [Lactiplantibacillus plantarum]